MKEYVKPSVAVYLAQHESALLVISAETTNPKEGGDPNRRRQNNTKSLWTFICKRTMV